MKTQTLALMALLGYAEANLSRKDVENIARGILVGAFKIDDASTDIGKCFKDASMIVSDS